ncbi:hypothetical protein [Streptomyces alboflavus]|uniref:hypothetical protein n=1 Tax=Streptomyces alboflavus TaxID=67267 RepID=UPI000A7A831E|nr:hypothetical protein [Streptomyces alboflavus]
MLPCPSGLILAPGRPGGGLGRAPSGRTPVLNPPPVEQIEAASREYEGAAGQARRTDHGEPAAKKVLDKLPASTYGTWRVFRTPSSR